MKHYTSSTHFSVLINSAPSGFFGSSRRVRQGDSLSPFLFVLVMEAFSRMLGAFTSRGLIFLAFLLAQVSRLRSTSPISFLQMTL